MMRISTALLMLFTLIGVGANADSHPGEASGFNYDASATISFGNTTVVCPTLDNKKAIYTFTSDDGFTNAAVFFNNEFKRLGLEGSLALVTNWINGSQTPPSTWEFWNTLMADGRFDVINHTKTHVKLSSISSTPAGQDSLHNEIIGNQTVFRTKFPGQDIISIANPAVVNTNEADVLIKQSHYAARNGTSGFNSLNPTETEWFKLKMLANYFSSLKRAAYSSEINKHVDNVITNKQWLILLTHGIGTGANAMPDTAFTRHFEYVAAKRADLWIAKLGDATKYIRQKQSAKVQTVDSTETRIDIMLTHQLDVTIFDHPLTLKTKLSVGWSRVTVTQGTRNLSIKMVEENNEMYVFYNAVPNGPVISLIKDQRASISTNESSLFTLYMPDKHTLTIEKPDQSPVELNIFNSAGQLCKATKLLNQQNNINISKLSQGVYMLKLTGSNNKTDFNKIIIN